MAGYREVPHTADWKLVAWAADLPGLFEQAALGMYDLSGLKLQPGPRLEKIVQITPREPERLLVAFLSELLFLSEQDHIGFDALKLEIFEGELTARMQGAPLASIDKDIKAVTYHNLQIRSVPQGLEVEIVFDV